MSILDVAMNFDLGHVARDLGIPIDRIQRTVHMLDEGNTVPFITRYRKDQTGGLDEDAIRHIQDRVTRWRQLVERKQTILKSIEAQGKLTPELANQINSADSLKRLEDLYLPFKPKKQNLATKAREQGLEPLETAGVQFDPHQHQAIQRLETDEHEEGSVVQEFQRGYNFRGRLLRPAMVQVAVKP